MLTCAAFPTWQPGSKMFLLVRWGRGGVGPSGKWLISEVFSVSPSPNAPEQDAKTR